MKELCPYRHLVSLLIFFWCVTVHAQTGASKVGASRVGSSPHAPSDTSSFVLSVFRKTYVKALISIGKQLKLEVSYNDTCRELHTICPAHGRMTFKEFFAPLKARGFAYLFFTDFSKTTYLNISRPNGAPHGHGKPGFVLFTKNEHHEPLAGVSAYNVDTRETAIADSFGVIRLEGDRFPMTVYLTHTGRQSLRVIIQRDSMTFSLDIDPQSLEAATVSYGGKKRAVSTSNFVTVVGDAVSYRYYGYAPRLSGVSNATVQTMLEGQVAGVLASATSGIPGSGTIMTVRSQGAIVSGIDPLYVVDGVPGAAGNSYVNNLQPGLSSGTLSSWSAIAPSDIEDIEVLKDADATAIYGSRGANGVVLITTPHWRPGLPRWDMALSAGFSHTGRRPAYMNTLEYLGMRREALRNSGLVPDSVNAPDIFVFDPTRNVDWGKVFLGSAAGLSNIRVGCSGGQWNNSYTVGMDYLKESTPFPTHPDHDRLTFNYNYNHVSANRRWTLQVAGLSGWDANHQFIFLDLAGFESLAPNAPALLGPGGQLHFPPGIPFFNPLTLTREPYLALSTNNLLSVVSRYQLSAGFSCETTVGVNHFGIREYGEMPLSAQNPAYASPATGFFAGSFFDSWIGESLLEYNRRAGLLAISGLAGASFQLLRDRSATEEDMGYANDAALLRRSHAIAEDSLFYSGRDAYTGFFGDLNLDFSDRYILNFTGRVDGSSRFPAGQRFGDFGAVAGAWVFAGARDRGFSSFLSYGKIKASQGVTGNNQTGDRSLESFAGTSIESFSSMAGVYPANSSGVGWQKTYKTELSLDLGFLRNRILFNATYYHHHIDNILQGESQPMTRTGSTLTSWPVVLVNSGYEFLLSATLADNSSFSWDVSLNWTVPRSKLASFPRLAQSPYANRLIVGQSLNVLRGYVFRGVDRQSGLYRFADLNGDGRITSADRKVVGKFDVTGFGGFENIIRWRQFQFQTLIDARLATGVNYLAAVFAVNAPGSLPPGGFNSNMPKVVLNHWRQPSDKAVYQRVYAGVDADGMTALNRWLQSSALLANSSFLRLRKLSVAYNLPPLRAATLHLTGLTVFLDAQNVFVLSPYGADAEIQSVFTTPVMRTFEFGVRVVI